MLWRSFREVRPPEEVKSIGNSGIEVQIDEQGKDDFAEKHRTGAIYDTPTGVRPDDPSTHRFLRKAGR
jgi:hypothetical protein